MAITPLFYAARAGAERTEPCGAIISELQPDSSGRGQPAGPAPWGDKTTVGQCVLRKFTIYMPTMSSRKYLNPLGTKDFLLIRG